MLLAAAQCSVDTFPTSLKPITFKLGFPQFSVALP